MKRIKNIFGFSIVEVTVSAIIFVITAAGIFSTLAILRAPAKVSQEKIQAAYYAQQILDELRTKVDQRNWTDTSASYPLSIGTHNLSSGIYTASYVVADAGDGARSVTLTVTW